MSISEFRAREILHRLEDLGADRSADYSTMMLFQDAVKLLKQRASEVEAARQAGTGAGRAQQQREGCQMVPAKPTPAMLRAGAMAAACDFDNHGEPSNPEADYETAAEVWRAMLAACPGE